MLKWNQRQVQKLTPGEIWLFIVGRVLVAAGLGMATTFYFPAFSRAVVIPLTAVGVVCLVVAGRGLFRRVAP